MTSSTSEAEEKANLECDRCPHPEGVECHHPEFKDRRFKPFILVEEGHTRPVFCPEAKKGKKKRKRRK